MKRHLTDEEIQIVLDEEGGRGEAARHLAGCVSCGARSERFRSLFALLDRIERIEPPASLEDRICARLFPHGAAARSPLPWSFPRWARVAAPLMLLAGSALLHRFILLGGALGDGFARWILHSHPELFRFAVGRLVSLVDLPAWFAETIAGAAALARPVGHAILLAGGSGEARHWIMISVGLFLLLGATWGSRLLLSRRKGGHHDLLLA